MIAIPLQGLAAASMIMCGSQHHMSPSHSIHQHANPSDQQVMQGKMQPQLHHDVLNDQVNNVVNSIDHSHHDSDSKLSAKHQCSTCAACCAGAVILSNVIKPQVDAATSERIAFHTIAPVGFITNGPERPPRFFA